MEPLSSSTSVRSFSGGDVWLHDSLSAVDAWPERAEWRVLVSQMHQIMASSTNSLFTYHPPHGEACTPNLDPTSPLLRLLHDVSAYLQTDGKHDSDAVRKTALLEYRRRLELFASLDVQTEPSMSSRCTSQVPSFSGTSTWSSRPSMQNSSYEQTIGSMSSRDHDFPSPSPLTFTFTKMSTNSFALEEEDILPSPALGRAANWPSSASSSLISNSGGRAGSTRPQTSITRTIRRSRSDLPPRTLRTGVAPAYFRQGGLFDLHEGDLQNEHVRLPVSSPQQPANTNDTPFPTIGECKVAPPQQHLRHRHSTSLPTYPPTSIPPERRRPPPKSSARSATSSSTTSPGMKLVPDQLPLSSPPHLQAFSYASSHALSSSDFSSSTSAIHTYTEPIYHHPHANDSWEVIHESRIFKPIIPGSYKRPKTPKSSKPSKSPRSPKLPLSPITPPMPRTPILHAGSTPHLSTPTPTATATPPVTTKGYDSEGLAPRLRSLKERISKGAQLHIRTGSLSSLATLGSTLSSPAKQSHHLPLVNVNMVVMGPQGSGVSSLIYRFINGINGWVAPATVDDFWHHVVRSKSEERITYYNITEVTGEEEYEGHRRSMLRRAQTVVLCFRLDRRVQFKRDVKRLLCDIASIGQIPVILVGTHHDSPQRAVSYDEASTFARSIQATYFESSAPLGRGVNEIFTAAANIQHASELQTTTPSPPPSASKSFFERMRRKTPPSSSAGSHAAWTGRRAFKCVVLGGKSSGKANMVHHYLHGVFEWLPEVPWMTWKASVKLDDDDESETPYALSIAEVGSARQYDYLRPQTYAGANAFVLCFDVGDYRDETMKEVRERWAAECRSHGPHIPIILVGTKIDQRQGTLRAFTPEQGRALATSIRAAAYLECSALNGEGVDLVFQTIVRVASGLML